MPRVPGRAERLLLSFVVGIGLVAMPAVALADPPVKFSEHVVQFSCGFPEVEVAAGAFFSSEFGASAFAVSPDLSGEAFEGVTVVEEGGGATIDAVISLFDGEGNPAGEAELHAVLTPTGQETVIEPVRDRVGNHWIRTTSGVFRGMAVSGSLMLLGLTLDFSTGDCFGEISDIQIHETPPETFVLNNTGVFIDCFWVTDDTVARFFAINDTFGVFADAFLEVPGEHVLFTTGEGQVTLTADAVSASIPMFDEITGMEESATATASFQPMGGPVTSIFLGQNFRQRVTEQRLIPDGTLSFSTGEEFTFDSDACFAGAFESHFIGTAPAGPKPGATAAANDTPDGAVALSLGKVVNDQTRNTAIDPELQVDACPQEDDRFGHTLWYSFTGPGGPVTIDTAGSDFDTVIAVYDDELTLLACNDDIEFEPIGGTLQAALTIDTVEGETYLIQAGGFDGVVFTGVTNPEFGRLRIKIS